MKTAEISLISAKRFTALIS